MVVIMKFDIKTTNFSKDYSIQEGLYNDLLGNAKEKFCKEVSESYDNLAFFALAPYGITGENWRENVDRVEIVEFDFVRHFFIDGGYVFSIFTEHDWSEFNDSHGYKIKIKYRVKVVEEMLGFTGPIR